MATYIRTHTPGDVNAAGTTVAATIAAATSPGNTLIAVVACNDHLAVTGISKPGGESASWVRAAYKTGGNTSLEVWAIKTTVAWSAATSVTATIFGSCLGKAITLLEYAGVATDTQTVVTDGGSFLSSITVATDHDVVPGDLLISAVVANTTGNSGKRVSASASPTGTAVGTAVGTDSRRPGYRLESLATLLSVTGAGSRSVSYAPTTGAGAPDADDMSALIVGLKSDDYAPDTPTLTSMASGSTINRASTNRASHTFSSANYIDSQSKFDLRYRLVGDPSWTTLAAAGTTALYYDFAPGSLTAGDYEQQVKVYGALGKESSWSASGYFTAADAPDGPTITYPTSGQMLDQFETVTWSTPDGQDSYQLRRVADDAGDPDPAMIYQDTGEVFDSITRELALNFSVNGRAEHIQLRVKVDDLWSDWDDVPVDVSYTPPPTPTMLLYPNAASFLVVITNPDPEEGDPAAVSNNVWITEPIPSGEIVEQRRKVGVSMNGSWVYENPVSGWDYGLPGRFVIEAVAANGTTARSGS